MSDIVTTQKALDDHYISNIDLEPILKTKYFVVLDAELVEEDGVLLWHVQGNTCTWFLPFAGAVAVALP